MGMIGMAEACTLTPINTDLSEVQKFVFDGGERFVDVPHAFFHYVGFLSGGRELVCDIQATQDDETGDFLLLDPVILSSDGMGITDVLSAPITGGNRAKQ